MSRIPRARREAGVCLLLLFSLLLSLSACTAANSPVVTTAKTEKASESAEPQKTEAPQSQELETAEAEKVYYVGISQFARHGSLDNCREGFIAGLAKEGIVEGKNLKLDYQNADASTATANQIAQNFVAERVDMICAIATPAAMSAFNAAMGKGIPVIYSAISDPVAAELAREDGSATGDVTGTSDALPVEAQLKMMREMLPEAKRLGILYTSSEANSLSTIKTYEALVANYGFELVVEAVAESADIPLATDSILTKVDCLTNLTDNTVVSSLPVILEKASKKKIPVFGSEVEQVRIGCLAAQGLDYLVLGEETGVMAARVLKGEAKASEIPFATIREPYLYVNKKVAEALGLEFAPSFYDSARELFETIEEPQSP